MLKKTIKYDLKNFFKSFIWIFGVLILYSGLARFFGIWEDIKIFYHLQLIMQGLGPSLVFSLIINVIIYLVRQFDKTLFKDQSYLTHTLPIKKSTLILSKFLSALIAIISCMLISMLGIFILFYSPKFIQELKLLFSSFSIPAPAIITIIITLVFALLCAITSMAFTAVIKAHTYNHRRIPKGFAWFELYNCVCLAFIACWIFVIATITGDFKALFSSEMSTNMVLISLSVSLASFLLFAVCIYFYCRKLFKKGVNID